MQKFNPEKVGQERINEILKFKYISFRRRMVQIINKSLLEQHKLDEAVALAKEVCQSDIDQESWELF